MPFDSRTELVGIVARHADGCPVRAGGTCRCGPLGYRAGVWDWEASAWVLGPLVETAGAAREWQRAAHALADDGRGASAAEPTGSWQEDEANPAEQLFWWAFCYVGLGFFGVALALVVSDLSG